MLQEDLLLALRPNDTADAQFASGYIRERQHDIGGVNAREFGEDRSRRMTETRTRLPLLERLPQRVADKADQDVRFDAFGLVVPDRAHRQVGLVHAEGGFGLSELDIGSPQRFVGPFCDVGAKDVHAFGKACPVGPVGTVGAAQPNPRWM